MLYLSVIPLATIPRSHPQIFSYFAAENNLEIGTLVSVPIRKRAVNALVISARPLEEAKMEIKKSGYELKKINKVLSSVPILTPKQIEFIHWMADYYFEPLTLVLKTFLPTMVAGPAAEKYLKDLPRAVDPPPAAPAKALLIEGKDREERYRQEIINALKKGKNALIIAPTVTRASVLYRWLKNNPADWKNLEETTRNSAPKKFFDVWKKFRREKRQVVVGSRAAFFFPFDNLGLVILDEEGDPSLKSHDRHPRYHLRELTRKLNSFFGVPILAGSSHPSPEIGYLAQTGRFKKEIIHSFDEDINLAIIDLKEELKAGNKSVFSRELQWLLGEIIKKKERGVLFLNRLGEYTYVFCRDCGDVELCPNCEVPLTYHRRLLLCHLCDWQKNPPDVCRRCRGANIKYYGAGTALVEKEFKKLFPFVYSERVDGETIKSPSALRKALDKFSRKEIPVLIGTEMILKTLLLPKIKLFCIVNIDPMFYLPDFRAGERLFATLGKIKETIEPKGTILVQTYKTDKKTIREITAQKYEDFLNEELQARKIHNYPPFSQLITLTGKNRDETKLREEGKIIAEKLKRQFDILTRGKNAALSLEILGPAATMPPKIKDLYGLNLLLKWQGGISLRNKILAVTPQGWEIDVDPEKI